MELVLGTIVVALAAGSDTRRPDQVELANGTKLEGRVVYQDVVSLVLRAGSRDREIAMKEVASVRSRAAMLHAVLEKWDTLDAPSSKNLLDLSSDCRMVDLVGEADVLAWKALLADPRSEAAHLALGHKPHENGWIVRDGTKTVASDKLDAFRSDWSNAWEFDTTHYHLRTNLPLRQAADIALDLEGFYRAFMDLFGRELKLFEVVEPMGAHVHADQRSFPEALDGSRLARFETSLNTLIVNASLGLDRGAIFHEATHGILNSTAARTRSGRGEIPGWLDEGLAEYMKWSMGGESGRAVFVPDSIAMPHFTEHARSKDAFDLSRVLTFASEDFTASKAVLKYAESYTLVHFCLHAEGGKYRERFLKFVRGAYLGKASMTDFKESFGMREKDVEDAWLAYVRRIAR